MEGNAPVIFSAGAKAGGGKTFYEDADREINVKLLPRWQTCREKNATAHRYHGGNSRNEMSELAKMNKVMETGSLGNGFHRGMSVLVGEVQVKRSADQVPGSLRYRIDPVSAVRRIDKTAIAHGLGID